MASVAKGIRRVWGAVKDAWRFGTHREQGRIVVPDSRLDGERSRVSAHMTFVGLRALLTSADNGDLARGLALFEEMEEMDASLASVANTRRVALTGLDYEVVSAADVQEVGESRKLADDAAAFVRNELAGIEAFEDGLEHLATAIGTNLAVLELVWEGDRLADLDTIPSRRLVMDATVPGQVNVITSEAPLGVPASQPKFVVHIPRSACGFPFSRSVMRSQAFVYLIKQLVVSDWSTFCELFGMPIRIAKFRNGTTSDEKKILHDMMRTLGSRAYAIVSEAVSIEFVESSQRGTAPYEAMLNWCDRTQAKVWLGGHLTSDTTGGTGTLAAGVVQNEVRQDLRDDDIKREGRTVRRQIIAPMCAAQFPGLDVPMPYFRRKSPETVDRLKEAQLFEAAQRAGVPIAAAYAHNRLGIPEPQEGEKKLEPSAFAMGEGLEEGF